MIRRIELHNFASHDDTELDFGNGRNVIIGATGSGKTNILQAIDFAFLGDVPDVNLPELIADNSDTTEAIVDYDDPRTGQTYRIHRTLKRTPDGRADHECSLTNLATSEVVKKPEPVRKTLESFGVDPSVWRYIVHVAQGKFGELLEETQDRKNSLDRLFQVSQLEAAHQELSRREGPITQIELRKQANTEKRISLERDANRLGEERTNLKRVERQRKNKEAELETLEIERDRLKEASQKCANTVNELKLIDDAIQKTQIASENALGQVNRLVAHLDGLLTPSKCAELRQLQSDEVARHTTDLQDDLRSATQQEYMFETAYQKSIEKAGATQSRVERAGEDRETIQQELEEVESYLDGKAKEPKIACDRCGSMLTKAQWKKHLEERRTTIKELEKLMKECSDQWRIEKAHVEECRRQRDDASSRVRNLGLAIPILKQVEEQRRIVEASGISERLKTRRKLLMELRTMLSADPEEIDQEIVEQASSITERLKSLLQRIEELKRELNQFDENFLNPQRKRVEDAQKANEEIGKLDPKIALDEKRILLLETIRTSLREIQPVVRRNFVAKVTQTANDYLKRLYGGAELKNFELTEDYQFLVTRAGYKKHARRLSGGQQVLASMAFLLALSEVLSQLDFLILDEPTTHLDESRRTELVTVLENLRRVPQLIIVDHHSELLEAADTRFHISLTPEGWSQIRQVGGS